MSQAQPAAAVITAAYNRPRSYATRDDSETERFFKLIYEQEEGPFRLLEQAAIREGVHDMGEGAVGAPAGS